MQGYLCAYDNKDPKRWQLIELELTQDTPVSHGEFELKGDFAIPDMREVLVEKGKLYLLRLKSDAANREGLIEIIEIEIVQNRAFFRGKVK